MRRAASCPRRNDGEAQPHLRCMQGSNSEPRRCVALSGELGRSVSCTIYDKRPTPCREFPVFFDDGSPNRSATVACRIGLPPLDPLRFPQAA